MNELLLSLMMFCLPFEYQTVDGFTVMPNCATGSKAAIEQAWADVKLNHAPFWVDNAPNTTPIMIGRYWFTNYSCHPTVKYGIMAGHIQGKLWLILHPDILKDRQAMAQAMDAALLAHEGRHQVNWGAFYGCLE